MDVDLQAVSIGMIVVRVASINGKPASPSNPLDEWVATTLSGMIQVMAYYLSNSGALEIPESMGVEVSHEQYDIKISVEIGIREGLKIEVVA